MSFKGYQQIRIFLPRPYNLAVICEIYKIITHVGILTQCSVEEGTTPAWTVSGNIAHSTTTPHTIISEQLPTMFACVALIRSP